MKKTKVRPRKQSSPKASTLAAKWLRRMQDRDYPGTVVILVKDLKTLCASVLAQDEIRGQK